MTQTPDSISVSPGQTITITCTVARKRAHLIAWYQKKAGQPPKLLLYHTSNRASGIADRFSGSGSGTQFTMTIKGVTEDDEGHYHCQQYIEIPSHTVIQSPTKTSFLFLMLRGSPSSHLLFTCSDIPGNYLMFTHLNNFLSVTQPMLSFYY
ncbi:unnamed protein product [Staurois parvus]|uniref:Ig-like domain-containing protein n=1 Tax=Staurois parvus TaxID=386267 RepID=A0ABN9H4H7_9NEOB|nr:unnamed protein product [Staurois parvus]